MSSISRFDAIVIGSGQSGNPLAVALANSGKKTAVIEATHIGGCCVNDGCTPTKTMIASGRVAYLARRARDYGVLVDAGEPKVDMKKVRQRKRDIVTSFRTGNENRLKAAGVEIIMGTAEFVREKELRVVLNDGGEKLCGADMIFINTGESPAVPKVDGLKEVIAQIPDRVVDSTSIQELGEVPDSLLVLGGGYIGLEFGQLFSRLGSKVTVIQRANRLIPREDPDITSVLKEILEADGMTIHVSTRAVKISSNGKGQIDLVISTSDGEQTIQGTHVLLAAGRAPNTDKLKPEKTGIRTTSRGYVQTNEKLETGVPGVYALGDVKGPPAFTHVSYDDFRILRDNLGLSPSTDSPNDKPPAVHTIKARDGLVPYCLYTDPQLGHVGLHLHDIPDSQRMNIKTAKMPMEYVARALETDEKRGLMKAIVNGQTGQILGFTCLGIEGGELMSVVQMAMVGGVKWWQLRDAVFAHPTIAESLNNLWGFLEDV